MADPATSEETVTIVLDGREVTARKGEMIIAAAERAGTYIPRFCYHPRMKPVGVCRMCLVEVSGPRGATLQPACFLPVADGQEVTTSSEKVKKAQDGILEFLLVNHPLDCPVCDKGGECPLQDQTISFGPGESRFLEEKRHWAKPIAISELVALDRERCIQCSRCTRFAAEVAGDPLIDFLSRGDRIEVNTFPDEPFTSYFSGNTVQICPVGALTATPYRFRARPWDLEQVESTCTTCSVGCVVTVQSSANRITRYLGIDSDPVNQSWMCDRGRFDFEAINSPDRLTQPLVREDGELRPATWGEALSRAARGVADARSLHGPDSVAVLGGARLSNEDAYAWGWLAKSVIGTDNVDAQMGDGVPAEVVLGLPRATIDQACQADVVILAGPDLKEELPVLYLRLRSAVVDGGLRIVDLSAVPHGLSRHAAVRLSHRPGEGAAVAAALVDSRPPTGAVAGVAAEALADARRLLADAKNVVVVYGRQSLAESADVAAATATAIAAARPDATFLPALRRSNVLGALDMGLAPGVLPGRVSLDAGREWFTEAWGGVPEQAGLDTAGVLSASADGRIAALVLVGADPVSDFPDHQLAERGVTGAGFVVAVDAFLTASSSRADVVLPAAVNGERPGTTTNIEGRVTRLGQKVVPPGVAWPDWMIASELAARLGGDLGADTVDELSDLVEATVPTHHGVTLAMLGHWQWRDGAVVPLVDNDRGASPGLGRPGGGPPLIGAGVDTTAGGTQPTPAPIDPMSDPGIGAVQQHGVVATAAAPPPGPTRPLRRPAAARPAPLRVTAARPAPPATATDAYSLRLVVGRRLYDGATFVAHSPHLAGLAGKATLRVAPAELERLGVRGGGQVRARSPRGHLVLTAVADPDVPTGVAWLDFNAPGGGANLLVDAARTVTDIRLETP